MEGPELSQERVRNLDLLDCNCQLTNLLMGVAGGLELWLDGAGQQGSMAACGVSNFSCGLRCARRPSECVRYALLREEGRPLDDNCCTLAV